jgi:hypothetical protein
LQGVFILTVILLLAIRDYNDASQRSVVYIFNPERWSGTETLFAIGALIVLFLTDYLIWKRRDHYLD